MFYELVNYSIYLKKDIFILVTILFKYALIMSIEIEHNFF